MKWTVPAGIAAVLAILLLLVPLVNHLIGGLDSLVDDLKPGDENELDKLPEGGVLDPELGGISGFSDGNYQSKPADPTDEFSPDRSSEGGDVVCDFVFDPALGCMQRLISLDAIRPDYNLYVKRPGLVELPVGSGVVPDTHSKQFVGKFPVKLQPGAPTPIYSVAPTAVISHFEVRPAARLTFLKDGADTFYVSGDTAGNFELEGLTTWAPPSYYTFRVPSGTTLSDIPANLRPEFPSNLRPAAAQAVASLNLTGVQNLASILNALKDYYSSFGEGEIPGPEQYADTFLAIHFGKNGCCRHRAFAFVVVAQSLGIPARFIANEAHAFVEVYVPGIGWEQLNLGGCGNYRVNNPEGYDTYDPVGRNATNPKPPAGTRPPPVPPPVTPKKILIPTFTDITESPSTVRASEPFTVRGFVQDLRTGAPVANVPVRLFLNVTKTSPGDFIGQGSTGPDGTWEISASVTTLPASDYQLVAGSQRTAKNDTHDWGQSWSDPPIRVTADTILTLDVPAKDGVDIPITLKGTLEDERGQPVSGQSVVVTVSPGEERSLTTDGEGEFSFVRTFTSTGSYAVRAEFAGTTNYFPSEAEAVLQIVDMSFTLESDNFTAARGESVALSGTASLAGSGQAGLAVALRYELRTPAVTASATTDAGGRFTHTLVLPLDSGLGPRNAFATLVQHGITKEATLTVYARPNLSLAHLPEVKAEAAITLTLQDEGGVPLANASVRLVATKGGGTLAAQDLTTGEDGRANATLNLSAASGDVSLEAVFDGQGYYQPASARSTLRVLGTPAPAAPIHLYALAAVPVGVVAAALVYRRFAERKGPTTFVPHGEMPRLGIEFPQIEPWLPLVWGKSEPLQVELRFLDPKGKPVEGQAVQLRVGSRQEAVSTSREGRASIQHLQEEEGEVEVVAEVKPRKGLLGVRAKVAVRIVDYRKEVAREWEEFKTFVRGSGVKVAEDTTPRELEARLCDVMAAPPELDWMLTVFEYANYSLVPFGRSDYVVFMRHRLKLNALLRPPPKPSAQASPETGTAGGESLGGASA